MNDTNVGVEFSAMTNDELAATNGALYPTFAGDLAYAIGVTINWLGAAQTMGTTVGLGMFVPPTQILNQMLN